MARATARWQSLIAQYQPPHLDEAIDESLLDYMATRKDAMPDAWY